MLNEHRNTKKQGDEGLGAAIAYFCERGDCVNIPLTDSQEYDLIADCGGTLRKIQVKTSTYKTKYGSYSINLSVKGGNRSSTGKIKPFDNQAVDFVFVLTPESRYLIPADVLGVSTATLGSVYDCYKV